MMDTLVGGKGAGGCYCCLTWAQARVGTEGDAFQDGVCQNES